MAYCQIKSTNPDLSYLIFKNPNSGMMIKELRKGHLFGWYSSPDTYNCYFKDAFNEVSYKSHPDDDFEYINTTRFNSANFVQNVITDFFQSTLKKVHPKDVIGFEHSFFINLILAPSEKYLKFFNKYFEGFTLDYEPVAPKNFSVTIKTTKTLFELLNFVNLFAVFMSLKNSRDFVVIDEGAIEKNMGSLVVIDAPYFMRYLFKVNFLTNSKIFEKYRGILENSKKEKIVFKKGSTFDMRLVDIEKNLSFTRPIVDIGCGEATIAFKCHSKIKHNYYAVDKEESRREHIKSKAERKSITNIQTLENYEQFKDLRITDKCEIILTEVIEHNSLEDSEKIIVDLLSNTFTERIIITTPNKDFNPFYLFDEDQLRHEDHLYEFTKRDFINWIASIVPCGTIYEHFDCGDEVNGIPVSLGVILRRAE